MASWTYYSNTSWKEAIEMKINSRTIAITNSLLVALLSFQITPVFGFQQNKRHVNKRRIQSRGTRPKINSPSTTSRSASARTGQVGNAGNATVGTASVDGVVRAQVNPTVRIR